MRILALLALILLNLTSATAQSITPAVINTSGNSYTQGYYSFDWSVGEMALVETSKSIDGRMMITNGFLQPGLNLVNLGRNFTPDEVKIFPNPTYGNLEINFSTLQQGSLLIRLYDANGKLVISRRTVSYGMGNIEHLNLSHFASGTYFLKIDLDPSLGSMPKTGSYKLVKL
jgi:hypothetical protein